MKEGGEKILEKYLKDNNLKECSPAIEAYLTWTKKERLAEYWKDRDVDGEIDVNTAVWEWKTGRKYKTPKHQLVFDP